MIDANDTQPIEGNSLGRNKSSGKNTSVGIDRGKISRPERAEGRRISWPMISLADIGWIWMVRAIIDTVSHERFSGKNLSRSGLAKIKKLFKRLQL